jgi:glucokinase
VGLIHAYDPSVVVLGGGVMASADQILPALSSYIERHAFTWWGKPELRKARLGPDAALMGALPLLQEWL